MGKQFVHPVGEQNDQLAVSVYPFKYKTISLFVSALCVSHCIDSNVFKTQYRERGFYMYVYDY